MACSTRVPRGKNFCVPCKVTTMTEYTKCFDNNVTDGFECDNSEVSEMYEPEKK